MEKRIFELIEIIDNEIQDSNASMVQAVNIGKHIDELKAKLRLVKNLNIEDKIFDIVTDLIRNDISKGEAIDKLLNLHSVSVSDTYIKKSNNLKNLRNYFFKYNDLIEDDFREHLTKKILKLDSELKKIESSICRTYRN